MEIKVVIDKKFAFVILGAILILAGAIHGYAQSPSIFGHEFEELQGVQAKLSGDNCAVGEVVKTINFDTGEVSCIDIEASSGIDWSEPITSTIIQDKTGTYDIYFQGGTAGSGSARNLALLGVPTTDKLYVNYNSEYTGGTRIGGPVTIVGSLTTTNGLSLVPCTLLSGGGNGCWTTYGEGGGAVDDVEICCTSGYITEVCQGGC